MDLFRGVNQLLFFFLPISFVFEEVCFRGLLDAHVHPDHEVKGFGSAFFVSGLWGIWHLPILPPGAPWFMTAPLMIAVHALPGVPLSYYWRRTGNLAVPAFSHALMDAIRDALSSR